MSVYYPKTKCKEVIIKLLLQFAQYSYNVFKINNIRLFLGTITGTHFIFSISIRVFIIGWRVDNIVSIIISLFY